jgi:hypothetical protein
MIPVKTIDYRVISGGALTGTLAFHVDVVSGETELKYPDLCKVLEDYRKLKEFQSKPMILFQGELYPYREYITEVLWNFQSLGYATVVSGSAHKELPAAGYKIGEIPLNAFVPTHCNEYWIQWPMVPDIAPAILKLGPALYVEHCDVAQKDLIEYLSKLGARMLPRPVRNVGVRIYGT